MEFIVTARDGTDPGAPDRRQRARERHLAGITGLVKEGAIRFGATILEADGKTIGSMVICDFPDRAALDAWLHDEPYVTEGVWRSVTVEACSIGPMFRR